MLPPFRKKQSNYSQLYTTFWDHVCGTLCPKSGAEMERLYEKGRMMAAAAEEMEEERSEGVK